MTPTLSPAARVAWLALNLVFAMGPTLLFFAWVEQNTALPWLPAALGWPWLAVGGDALPARVAWDVGLFFAFGLLHSSLAQVGAQERLRTVVPPPTVRTVYLAATGLALFAMMALWQSTGVVAWELTGPGWAAEGLAALLFVAPMAGVLLVLGSLGFLEFVGWAQLFDTSGGDSRTAGTPALRTTGVYGWVRHPVYTGLLAAFLLGPRMTLDRLLVFFSACLYLAVGIPVEERKLVRLFGTAYARYRRRVPALFPFPRKRGRRTAPAVHAGESPAAP